MQSKGDMGAMDTYLPRIADKLLEERMEAKGAVLIQGSKWCGKTTTAKKQLTVFSRWTDPT